MGKYIVARRRTMNGGQRKTAKADPYVHVCIGAVVQLPGRSGNVPAVMFHMARRCVAYPQVPTEQKTVTTFVMTAADIAWSAHNAHSASELQLAELAKGFERLEKRPLPRDKTALEREIQNLPTLRGW